MDFYNLPLPIKAKIMYSGYIIHPVAKIFKEYIKNLHIPITDMIYPENPSFIQYLRGLGELEEITDYIHFDNFLDYIFQYHMF